MKGLGLKTADGLFPLPVSLDLISMFVRFAAPVADGDIIRVKNPAPLSLSSKISPLTFVWIGTLKLNYEEDEA